MSLKDQITEDMKVAMRAKDAARLLTIRGLLAACKQREVDERIILDDAAVIAIIDKLVKQRKDSIAQFTAGNRPDLVEKEAAELQVLEAYLPQRLGADEIAVTTVDGQVIEKRVPLPERWVRGFAEVAVALSPLEPVFELSAAGLCGFLDGLPTSPTRGPSWVVPSGTTARVASAVSHA